MTRKGSADRVCRARRSTAREPAQSRGFAPAPSKRTMSVSVHSVFADDPGPTRRFVGSPWPAGDRLQLPPGRSTLRTARAPLRTAILGRVVAGCGRRFPVGRPRQGALGQASDRRSNSDLSQAACREGRAAGLGNVKSARQPKPERAPWTKLRVLSLPARLPPGRRAREAGCRRTPLAVAWRPSE